MPEVPWDLANATGDDRLAARMRAESERARRATEIARRHEAMVVTDPPLSDLHRRMAAMHRQMERRHLVTALLYGSVLSRLGHPADTSNTARADEDDGGSALLRTTARLADSTGAIATIFGTGQAERMVLASDSTARRADDLEYETGEGPGLDAIRTNRMVAASGRDLGSRWHLYGPGVHGLRVRSVAAVPLRVGTTSLGALTVLNPRPAEGRGDALTQLGEAVARSLLDSWLDEDDPILHDHASLLPELHQAAGALSVRRHCSVDDALALIKARAFAEDQPLEAVARDILRDRRDLADGPGL